MNFIGSRCMNFNSPRCMNFNGSRCMNFNGSRCMNFNGSRCMNFNGLLPLKHLHANFMQDLLCMKHFCTVYKNPSCNF